MNNDSKALSISEKDWTFFLDCPLFVFNLLILRGYVYFPKSKFETTII